MTQAIPPLPQFQNTSGITHAHISPGAALSNVQKLDKEKATVFKTYFDPKDTFLISDATKEKNQWLNDHLFTQDYLNAKDAYETWNKLEPNLTLDEQAMTLINFMATHAQLNSSNFSRLPIAMLIYTYDKVEPYFRELIAEELIKNVEPFLVAVTTEMPENLLMKLVEDSVSDTPKLKALTEKVLEIIATKTKKELKYETIITEFKKLRPTTKQAFEYQEVIRKHAIELPHTIESVKTSMDLINDIENPENVLDVIPYKIGNDMFNRIHKLGIAIVLHASASMVKFHATISGLDVFRLPYDLNLKKTDEFFTKLLSIGFHNIVVLMPDSKVWPDYKIATLCQQKGIHVFDTKTFGLGLGMILHESTKKILECQFFTKMEWINDFSNHLKHWVILFNPQHIERNEWLNHYQFEALTKTRQLGVIINDSRPNEGLWVPNLDHALQHIKNDLETFLENNVDMYSRIVIVHESPFKDDLIPFAYEIRKKAAHIPILIRHRAPRQQPYFGTHISIALI